MGGGSASDRAVVQSGGHGFRLEARAFKEELDGSPNVMHLLLCCAQSLIAQMAQQHVGGAAAKVPLKPP